MSIFKTAKELDFYTEMGIDLSSLGCVMLDTDSPIEGGFSSVDSFHVTVRYGLLVPPVRRIHVEEVLADLYVPDELAVIGLDAFPINDTTEAIVALVESLAIRRLNQALSVLPNVTTFPEFRPHVTLGYFDTGSYDEMKFNLFNRLKESVKVGNYSYNKVFD